MWLICFDLCCLFRCAVCIDVFCLAGFVFNVWDMCCMCGLYCTCCFVLFGLICFGCGDVFSLGRFVLYMLMWSVCFDSLC